ncbi:hypothetical protein J7E88_17785 [Streptomyces sp. ISL-10]|uniref:hypothetical protein n=1 Tax=Streptomyces sp. ISL-10 TaxID=2819172 RepID=UPI001BE97EA0|nr:hypothetical protein [Streptomyces sp. ISL-10]MBT2367107.1 hypothetical protein [Streptomyces sp. ISL-10]
MTAPARHVHEHARGEIRPTFEVADLRRDRHRPPLAVQMGRAEAEQPASDTSPRGGVSRIRSVPSASNATALSVAVKADPSGEYGDGRARSPC